MTGSAPNSLDFACDWRLALNLSSSRQGCLGYLLSFSGLGSLKLSKDIEVWNPISDSGIRTVVSDDKVKCIGLIESFAFEGGQTDPIRIKSYMSKGNAADLRAKLARPLSSTSLKIAWYIVDFDSEMKTWFEAAFVKQGKEASANVDSTGGELQLFVDNQPTQVMPSLDIGVYSVVVQTVPADNKSAVLEFATGPRRRLIKSWGE
ncbi:MAG: hypothetical protein AAFV29_02095 [Myxococcota bacterium]